MLSMVAEQGVKSSIPLVSVVLLLQASKNANKIGGFIMCIRAEFYVLIIAPKEKLCLSPSSILKKKEVKLFVCTNGFSDY